MVGTGSTLTWTARKAEVWLSRINGMTTTIRKEKRKVKPKKTKKKKVSEKRNQKGRTATGKNAKSLGETQVLTQKY